MRQKIYMRDDLSAKFRLSHARLSELERLKLIRPTGLTEDQVPVFSEDTLRQIAHIQKLQDLGYELEEITKILKKVGLPKTEGGKSGKEKPDPYLTVGNLAEKIGVSPRTIKHWEDMGIIVPEMRTEGGFRLYPEIYVYLCNLIKDLQLFGYSLEEIKVVSDYFRDFLEISEHPETISRKEVHAKLDAMVQEIKALFDKMELFKKGIARWEDLLKKKKKEVLQLKNKGPKNPNHPEGKKNA
jgi:DNA-binding transcriptional MerR regulator